VCRVRAVRCCGHATCPLSGNHQLRQRQRAGTGLTLNAGIRYDLQFLDTVRTDRNNFSPRLGFAWILSAGSDDAGPSFSRARALAGGEASGNRGREAVATDAEGRVVSVWLDHRELAGSGHEHASAGKAPVDGAARAQLSKLYFSQLDDAAGGSEAAGRAIAAGVCYCCKTALAAGADGSIFAAWRHVYPGNIRDIAFTVSRVAAAPLRSRFACSTINGSWTDVLKMDRRWRLTAASECTWYGRRW
jgi:hypothetical protein